MSKIYVASNFEEKARAKSVADNLRDVGYKIVSTWIDREEKPWTECSFIDRAGIAIDDWSEVMQADYFVLISARPENTPKGGKFVEAGIAIGLDKPVFILGKRENVLLYHPNVIECDSLRTMHLAMIDYEKIKNADALNG